MLEAIGLTKRYNGETALYALDLRIARAGKFSAGRERRGENDDDPGSRSCSRRSGSMA